MYYSTQIATTHGNILIFSDGSALTGLFFGGQKYMPLPDQSWQENNKLDLFSRVKKQITEYFQGTRIIFDIPYTLTAGTIFQQQVWQAAARVPFGHTISYRQLAESMGIPSSTRAVARALGCNPLLLIIPCHRIIGSNGSLTGYAAGLERKQVFLTLEKRVVASSQLS